MSGEHWGVALLGQSVGKAFSERSGGDEATGGAAPEGTVFSRQTFQTYGGLVQGQSCWLVRKRGVISIIHLTMLLSGTPWHMRQIA